MTKTPNMPTVDDFLEATTVRMGGKLGLTKLGPVLTRDRLADVDVALAMWWSEPATSAPDKLRATLRLMKACSDWAGKHQTNKGATRTGAQRMIAVKNVMDQCGRWIARIHQGSGSLKKIENDYAGERANYKSYKDIGQKVNPVSGSWMHSGDVKGAKSPDAVITALIDKARMTPDQMTAGDYDTLHTALAPNNGRAGRVLYLDSSNRSSRLAEVKNGVLYGPDNKPLADEVAYAMSKYGSLYVYSIEKAMNFESLGPTEFFNHTSFMAGKDVICAGTIQQVSTFRYGKSAAPFVGKWAFTTQSGHYKPTVDHLKNCLKTLWYSGLNLSEYAAVYYDDNGANILSADQLRQQH